MSIVREHGLVARTHHKRKGQATIAMKLEDTCNHIRSQEIKFANERD